MSWWWRGEAGSVTGPSQHIRAHSIVLVNAFCWLQSHFRNGRYLLGLLVYPNPWVFSLCSVGYSYVAQVCLAIPGSDLLFYLVLSLAGPASACVCVCACACVFQMVVENHHRFMVEAWNIQDRFV